MLSAIVVVTVGLTAALLLRRRMILRLVGVGSMLVAVFLCWDLRYSATLRKEMAALATQTDRSPSCDDAFFQARRLAEAWVSEGRAMSLLLVGCLSILAAFPATTRKAPSKADAGGT